MMVADQAVGDLLRKLRGRPRGLPVPQLLVLLHVGSHSDLIRRAGKGWLGCGFECLLIWSCDGRDGGQTGPNDKRLRSLFK